MTIDIIDHRDNRRKTLAAALSWRGDKVRLFRMVDDHLKATNSTDLDLVFLHVGQHQHGAMEALRAQYAASTVVTYSGGTLIAEEMMQHQRVYASHYWYKRAIQSSVDPTDILPPSVCEDLRGFIVALEKEPASAGWALERIDWTCEAALELLVHMAKGRFPEFQQDELFRHLARFDAGHERKLMRLIEENRLREIRDYLLDRHEFT